MLQQARERIDELAADACRWFVDHTDARSGLTRTVRPTWISDDLPTTRRPSAPPASI